MKKLIFSIYFLLCPIALFGSFESLLEPVSVNQDTSSAFQNDFFEQRKNSTPTGTPYVPNYKKEKDFVIDRSMITSLLRDSLIDKFSPNGNLKVEIQRPWNDLLVNPSNWTIDITEFPAEGLQKKINLRFRIYSDAEQLGEWYLPVRCALWQEGLLLKTKLSKGQALEENHFKITPVNVLNNNSLYVPSAIEIEDYETTRSLNHTSILEWNDIREKPVVRKGQVIDVIVDDGLMSIRTRGTAMESGSLDEMIFVRNLASSKKVQGKVINDSTVQVYF